MEFNYWDNHFITITQGCKTPFTNLATTLHGCSKVDKTEKFVYMGCINFILKSYLRFESIIMEIHIDENHIKIQYNM